MVCMIGGLLGLHAREFIRSVLQRPYPNCANALACLTTRVPGIRGDVTAIGDVPSAPAGGRE